LLYISATACASCCCCCYCSCCCSFRSLLILQKLHSSPAFLHKAKLQFYSFKFYFLFLCFATFVCSSLGLFRYSLLKSVCLLVSMLIKLHSSPVFSAFCCSTTCHLQKKYTISRLFLLVLLSFH